MLVDLLRNDLARVSEPGSVEVTEAFTVERYSHVMHLVSEVRGRSRAPVGDAVAAIFPGGTITGAPKESVMREIARLEPVPRGAYTGSLGFVSGAGADFNILIRSLTLAGDTAYISGGGGIVIESDPPNEYLETRHKVEALLHVLGQGAARAAGGGPAPRLQLAAAAAATALRRPRPLRRVPRLVQLQHRRLPAHASAPRSTCVDHEESRTPWRRAAGAGDAPTGAPHPPWPGDARARRARARRPRHVGRDPRVGRRRARARACRSSASASATRRSASRSAPASSARPAPSTARLTRCTTRGRGIFAGIPDPELFTRYHSLCLTRPAADADARGVDGTPATASRRRRPDGAVVMAVAHTELPAWGVQFHPESMLSRARPRAAGELPRAAAG